MACGLFDHFGREAVGQVKLADHDLDVDSEVVFFAENFDHAAAGLLRGAWPVGDFYVYYYAFQILRGGVDCGFFAYYSIGRCFFFFGRCGCLEASTSKATTGDTEVTGVEVTGDCGFSIPGGITISWVTFSSMGLT